VDFKTNLQMEVHLVVAVVVLGRVLVGLVRQPLPLVLLAAVAPVTMQIAPVVVVRRAAFALSGPAQVAHSHQQIQETCNETLYSHKRWATF
jgi:hypothetical protein